MSTRDPLDDALAVWREDAQRTADAVDVHGDLADRIVAELPARAPALRPSRAPTWYAAAALFLIGVGIAGTLYVREAAPTDASPTPRWADLDEELMNALAHDPAFEPGLGR